MSRLTKILPSYDDYNDSITRYNAWFIKLRWYAVASLIVYLFTFIFAFSLTWLQTTVILFSAFIISGYNFYFYQKSKIIGEVESVKPVILSLQQIILDLFVLGVIVYFSGGVEAPIFMFYIFHMIIGSLIFPVKLMYITAGLLITLFSALSFLEFYGIIPHQTVQGLYPYPLYKEQNYVIGFISIFSFVLLISIKLTSKIAEELYSRERQLKLALEDVRLAEESKQKYIMAVVHELKSPIAAATSGIELVLGNYLGEVKDEIHEVLNRVKTRLHESIENINSILRVSRFKLLNKIEEEELIVSEIIESIIDKIKPVAERKQIEIILEKDENKIIKGDKVLIELILSNLVGNAVKYTPRKGQIIISFKNSVKELVLEINDDGIGIPKNDLEKIFDEYYRASNVKNIEGTGTGLSLVKQIIGTHKGKIEIYSPSDIGNKERPGTKVLISLPYE